MKKITLALITLMTISTSLMAQVKEGKITYERKTNMHRFITDPEMKARIPEFRTDNFELLFNFCGKDFFACILFVLSNIHEYTKKRQFKLLRNRCFTFAV